MQRFNIIKYLFQSMFYIFFGGRQSNGNLELIRKLSDSWVTFHYNPKSFLYAISIMNHYDLNSYDLILLDPCIVKKKEQFEYVGKILKLNHKKRRTGIIKDNALEGSISLYRDKYDFYEFSKESDLVVAINKVLLLN